MEPSSPISELRSTEPYRKAFVYDFPELEIFWASREPLKHHATMVDLRQSAERGCHLCSLFVGSLDRGEYTGSSSGHTTQLWFAPCRKPNEPPRIYKDTAHDNRPVLLYDTRPWECAAQVEPLAKVQIYRCSNVAKQYGGSNERWGASLAASAHVAPESCRFRWSLSTGSAQGMKLIAAWLRQFVNEHGPCKKRFGGYRPCRILDLASTSDSGDLRLVSTSDIETQPYATLSYSWGNRATVMLTTTNYETFRSRIAFNTLPKTVQHAIRVCRQLQVRYLWVDALCIIQGSDQDFAREVSQMGSIYAESLFTIAAAQSTDCTSGFFEKRQPLQVEDCQLLNDGDSTTFFAGTYHDDSDHYLADRYLDTRAWVYQERMMAPRTVHFNESEIIWECREQLRCQRCAVSPKPRRAVPNDGQHKPLFTKLIGLTPDALNKATFEKVWYDMLRVYTKAVLSNEDDRLSALAGLAQLLNRHTHYDSSFGLWLPFFLDQLLWCYWSGQRGRWQNLKDIPGLPSWSWVGIRGGIGRLDYCLRNETEVFSAELLQTPPPTPFGQLSVVCEQLPLPACVKIRGWTTNCQAVPVSRGYGDFTPSKEWALSPISGTRSTGTTSFTDITWDLLLNDVAYTTEQADFVRKSPMWRQYYHPDAQPQREQRLVCLLIKRRYEYRRPEMQEYGLVLERVCDSKNQYLRRGVYTGFSSRFGPDLDLRAKLRTARESHDEHAFQQAQKEHDACTEILSSKDEQRTQKLLNDHYSFFKEAEPMVELEII